MTESAWRIRPAVIDDVEAIAAFDEFKGSRMREVTARACWVAAAGADVVGYASYEPRGLLGEPLLTYLCVRESHRQQGIGTALIRAVVAVAAGRKLISSTAAWCAPMHRMFTRLGFVRVGALDGINKDGSSEVFYAMDLAGAPPRSAGGGAVQLADVPVLMEPIRITPPQLAAIERELAAREPIFHHPELGTTRHHFEGMTAEDFWEIGASGRRYSREFVIETLLVRTAAPHEDAYETSEFFTQQVAQDLYLLTFTLRQGARVTRRATLWRRVASATGHDWKIVFHQGTVAEPT